jgi:hypothetical protein
MKARENARDTSGVLRVDFVEVSRSCRSAAGACVAPTATHQPAEETATSLGLFHYSSPAFPLPKRPAAAEDINLNSCGYQTINFVGAT